MSKSASNRVYTAVYSRSKFSRSTVLECTRVRVPVLMTKKANDGAGAVDCDSRRAVGPTKVIRGVL